MGAAWVRTGCQNCVRCTGSVLGNAARSATGGTVRVMLAVCTLGLTMLLTRKCRACSHRRADHR